MKTMMHFLIYVFGPFFAMCLAQDAVVRINVTNPAGFSRSNETISIQWSKVSAVLSAGTKSVVVTDGSSGKEILSQIFDENLDGKPDALLFQSDFAPHETKVFTVAAVSGTPAPPTSLVDARYVEPREDVAWENDRIAYRMYGPALAAEVDNGIDVWTKRVRYLIVKKWYEGEEQTPKIIYHIDHGEGADFFDVGRSLGCGGSGIWHNNRVYQAGVFSSYKIVSTGPIRACFELYYNKWNIDGASLKETKRITLDAGQNLNRISVTFSGGANDRTIDLACGLVKRPNTKPYTNTENGWMSLWGQTNDSLPNGDLGTGVVFQPNKLIRTTEDSSQYLMLAKTKIGSSFNYAAGAGWTRSGDFTSVDDWNGYLNRWALLQRWPLVIKISTKKGN
ncbi:MAG TPA: DUF4861 domain-containing protein [Bacteroidota bacterium]|nr:DUF4861 domain-containing protein [Bacteroidota bacterium]